jgi:hypothetical protein
MALGSAASGPAYAQPPLYSATPGSSWPRPPSSVAGAPTTPLTAAGPAGSHGGAFPGLPPLHAAAAHAAMRTAPSARSWTSSVEGGGGPHGPTHIAASVTHIAAGCGGAPGAGSGAPGHKARLAGCPGVSAGPGDAAALAAALLEARAQLEALSARHSQL